MDKPTGESANLIKNPTIIGAIIGGIFLIVGTTITGIFTLRNTKLVHKLSQESEQNKTEIQRVAQESQETKTRIEALDNSLEELKQIVGDGTPYPPSQSQNNTSSSSGENTEVSNEAVERLFECRNVPTPPPPDGLDHINGFFQEPISTGEGLKAETLKEAWVMAYIEKHMGDFRYRGQYIYTYGDRNGKRDAIIRLVKEEGADKLLNQIAPLQEPCS